ncbi:glycosyl hydrolase [Aspergillus pseudoustus]|uniref:Glycosyl hydrolase n=1 Tax=Aspergillus pseudoustus TaxID=1810923 RepID=A0ABR4ISH5_9EURO
METTYRNPAISGMAPDPSIIRVDDTYYLVCSSFHLFPGLPIYASKNLKDWKHITNAINRPDQLTLRLASTFYMALDTGQHMVASGGLFAATIRYHKGKFYVICTNAAMPSEDMGGTDNFIVSTTDIYGGKWSDPVYIPYNGIDPDLFFDDDGKVWFQACYQMNREVQPSCNIRQFQIDLETGKPLTELEVIWGGYAKYDTEGPHIHKVGDWYYLLAAEGGTFEHHMLSIARSKNVQGPYETAEQNPIVTADGKPEYIQNVGHGDLVQDPNGNWWAVMLAVRDEKTCQPLGRETFLSPVDWHEGGWPLVRQPKMEFTGPAVGDGSEWNPDLPPRVADVYIGEPDAWRYKLPVTTQGPFSLTPSMERMADPRGPTTFIGRRQTDLAARGATAIDLRASKTTLAGGAIKAGLAVYKDYYRHAYLSLNFNTREIILRTIDLSRKVNRVAKKKYQVPEGIDAVALQIISNADKYTFSVRPGAALDGDAEWIEIGTCETKELAAREMTGPILGTFANTTTPQGERAEVCFTDLVVTKL